MTDFASDARRRPSVLRLCAVLAVVLPLAACGGDEEPEYVERPVEDLYNSAVDNLEDDQLTAAAAAFDEVERQHPYSVWATKALLMAAYARYLNNDYDEAVASLDRFIQLHPGNRDISYAYYLRALCFYERISDVVRDQQMTRDALAALEEVVRRYPNSEYARDSRLKADLARDHLAGHEMEIGRWYLRNDQFLAAINRFREVVETYQTTTHTPEALHRLVESYLTLGVVDEAQTAAAVLGHNYPGSGWYEDSFALLQSSNLEPAAQDGSWLSDIWDSIL